MSVSVITCKSDRLVAIKLDVSGRHILIFCVYMPTDCGDNLVEFSNCLSEVAAIVEQSSVEAVFMLGDLNAHPGELFGREMLQFCEDQKWTCIDLLMLGMNSDSYTYVSEVHGCRRWLDHCLVTESAGQSVNSVKILHNVYWSDHFPLEIKCNFSIIRPKKIIALESNNKIIWGNRNKVQISKYTEKCHMLLQSIDYPSELRTCCDQMCDKLEHRLGIDLLYKNIIDALSTASIESYLAGKSGRGKRKTGWNKHVREAHGKARLSFLNWVKVGKPSSGEIYDSMIENKKIFKGKLKFSQKNEEQTKMDNLATLHKEKKIQ